MSKKDTAMRLRRSAKLDRGELFGMMASLANEPARKLAAQRMKTAFKEAGAKTDEKRMTVLRKLINDINKEKEKTGADERLLTDAACCLTTMYIAMREKQEVIK